MMVAPKSKLVWRWKAVPNATSSQASQKGGGGVVGWQNLKVAKKR
jgi:hypothetical protein